MNTNNTNDHSGIEWGFIDLYDSVMQNIEPLLMSEATDDLRSHVASLSNQEQQEFAQYCELCIELCIQGVEQVLSAFSKDLSDLKELASSVQSSREEQGKKQNITNVEHLIDSI